MGGLRADAADMRGFGRVHDFDNLAERSSGIGIDINRNFWILFGGVGQSTLELVHRDRVFAKINRRAFFRDGHFYGVVVRGAGLLLFGFRQRKFDRRLLPHRRGDDQENQHDDEDVDQRNDDDARGVPSSWRRKLHSFYFVGDEAMSL